jgi:hypothetical protein
MKILPIENLVKTNPIQSQNKPNQTQFQKGYLTALRSVAQDKFRRNDNIIDYLKLFLGAAD